LIRDLRWSGDGLWLRAICENHFDAAARLTEGGFDDSPLNI